MNKNRTYAPDSFETLALELAEAGVVQLPTEYLPSESLMFNLLVKDGAFNSTARSENFFNPELYAVTTALFEHGIRKRPIRMSAQLITNRNSKRGRNWHIDTFGQDLSILITPTPKANPRLEVGPRLSAKATDLDKHTTKIFNYADGPIVLAGKRFGGDMPGFTGRLEPIWHRAFGEGLLSGSIIGIDLFSEPPSQRVL